MIADDIRLSRAMADAVARHPELELFDAGAEHHDVPLRPGRSARRRRRRGVEQRTSTSSTATLLDRAAARRRSLRLERGHRGRYVLRACIVNFHTDRADVEALPEIVVRRGRALWAEQRKGGTA